MNAEERIAELEAHVVELLGEKAAWQEEAKDLREQLAQALGHIAQLMSRVHELEGREKKDSHNSSKPPSSDGQAHAARKQRKVSGKKSGGQPGHEGYSLKLVERPDEVRAHRPSRCAQCQQLLEGVEGDVVERRQVHDLPPWRLVVTEHQVEEVCCPHCQHVSRGSFPEEVSAPAQYGAGVKALAVYLHQYQLVPLERTAELLEDLCGCRLSEGSLTSWEQEAASRRWNNLPSTWLTAVCSMRMRRGCG
jgi:transposase